METARLREQCRQQGKEATANMFQMGQRCLDQEKQGSGGFECGKSKTNQGSETVKGQEVAFPQDAAAEGPNVSAFDGCTDGQPVLGPATHSLAPMPLGRVPQPRPDHHPKGN